MTVKNKGGRPTRFEAALTTLIEVLIDRIANANVADVPLKDAMGLLSTSMRLLDKGTDTAKPKVADFDESTATLDQILAHRAKHGAPKTVKQVKAEDLHDGD